RGGGGRLRGLGSAGGTGGPRAWGREGAGLRGAAVEGVLRGAARGPVAAEPGLGQIAFARSLPVAKARQPDVLLAYRMNGADLPAAHGAPVRVVVPDWYGMASVKWLERITVSDRPFTGFFQTMEYTVFERRDGQPQLVPITEMQVKALIAQPAAGRALERNAEVRVHGAAWTGESEVTRVDVSTDGGQTWQQARLLNQAVA